MKRPLIIAAFAIGSLLTVGAGLWLEPVAAQAPQADSNMRFAVIDIERIFKDYTKFSSLRESFKTEIENKENELKTLEAALRGKVESMKSVKAQADRERIEREINSAKFEFDKKIQSYKGDLARREADLYSTVYKEVTDLVSQICKKNGIFVVFKIQSDKDDPAAVLQTVSREIVYHHPNLDITEVVLQTLNKNFQQMAQKDQPPAR